MLDSPIRTQAQYQATLGAGQPPGALNEALTGGPVFQISTAALAFLSFKAP